MVQFTDSYYYKLGDYYNPKFESGINFNDSTIKIKLKNKKVKLSEKDKNLMSFREFKKKIKYL